MKSIKRALSLILAFTLVFALCVPAFADADNGMPQYKYYTVLGDSNASGYGLDAYFENAGSRESVLDCCRIDGAYPDIFADAIKAETVDVRAHSGWRTNEFLMMLNPSLNIEISNTYKLALGFIGESVLDGETDRINTAVRNANIISLNFGSNDIYTYGFNLTTAMHDDLGDGLKVPENAAETFQMLCLLAQKAGQLDDVIRDFKKNLDNTCQLYKDHMKMVIDEIRKVNDSAKIMVLGVFCPVSFDIRVNHKVVFDIKTSTDKRMKDVNNYLKSLCAKNEGCTFVDISKTECYGLPALDFEKLIKFDENVKYSAVKMLHPCEAAHKYIAQQMINTLKADSKAPNQPIASFSKLLQRTTLKWDRVPGAVSYRIYRAKSYNGDFKYVGSSLNTSFYDITSGRSVDYYYKVCAVMNLSGSVLSAMSKPASVRIK